MPENKAKIHEDDFVSKVVKDPKQPPDTLLLNGFLGKSSEDGHVRLYFDPELKSYVEIPQDAILHSQEISKESSPLGGHHVWINPNAELIHGRVGPQRTKAKFFEGPLGAAAAGMGAAAQPAMPYTLACFTVPVHCGRTNPPHCFPHLTAGFPCFGPDVAANPHRIPIGLPTQHCATPMCTVGAVCSPPGFTVIGCFGPEAAINPQFAPQAVHPLPSAHPVCPTLFQHCPTFGCPVSAHCITAACTLSGNQCNITGFGCPTFGCTLTIECTR